MVGNGEGTAVGGIKVLIEVVVGERVAVGAGVSVRVEAD
jgi:hypothetical protein